MRPYNRVWNLCGRRLRSPALLNLARPLPPARPQPAKPASSSKQRSLPFRIPRVCPRPQSPLKARPHRSCRPLPSQPSALQLRPPTAPTWKRASSTCSRRSKPIAPPTTSTSFALHGLFPFKNTKASAALRARLHWPSAGGGAGPCRAQDGCDRHRRRPVARCCRDTDVTASDIAKRFGEQVAHIVEGVTKLDKIKFANREDHQAENIRKMLLAMVTDLRVVIIKLADRLHNMRTLEHLNPEKQRRIARETLDVYAPLAHRLGMGKLRGELEDLAFRYIDPLHLHAALVRGRFPARRGRSVSAAHRRHTRDAAERGWRHGTRRVAHQTPVFDSAEAHRA